jgi:hypothetical protein
MMVWGGVGLGAIYGDLHSLRVRDRNCTEGHMVWEEVAIEGSPPSAR